MPVGYLGQCLDDRVFHRFIPKYAVYRIPPPLHAYWKQACFFDILPNQSSFYVETSDCSQSCSEFLRNGSTCLRMSAEQARGDNYAGPTCLSCNIHT